MPTVLTVDQFLSAPGLMLDTRSPGEYQQGHLPNAVSFPLFTDAERAQVGTCYKQQGRDEAVELGLALVGPKLAGFVQQAKTLAPDRQVRLHCWRGGMRSGSMAILLETAGFQVSVLNGGYKAFRRWVRTVLATPKPVLTLGGMTGTGKTEILADLAQRGEQVLDLEALANHRGSSYGSVGLPPQPSTEHFENLVAMQWWAYEPSRPVWIEAESRRVGTCRVPDELFQQMMNAPVIEIVRSRQERIDILKREYGQADRAALIQATERIRKRLGGDRTQQAIERIQAGDADTAIDIVLNYYDKTYQYDLERRQVTVYPIEISGAITEAILSELVSKAQFYSTSLAG